MFRVILAVVGVVVLIGGLTAANLRRDSGVQSLDWRILKTPPREVIVETPANGEIVQTVTAPGAVELVEEAQIASQIVGRVIEVKVKDGDRVKGATPNYPGDLLVKLDETDARARFDSARSRLDRLQAAITQAEAEFRKTQRDFDRSSELAGRGVVTPTELADFRTILAKAGAALLMSRHEHIEAEAMLKSAKQDLDRTAIHAPIDGVVLGLDVEVGEVIIAGTTNLPGTVLMTIGDPARLRIRADVDETDVPMVHSGQAARIFLQADPTNAIAGRVDLVAPKGKKTTEVVSFETLVLVDHAESTPLKPGMSATVEIEVERKSDALGIPLQAVVHRRRKDLPDSPAVRDWAERHAHAPGEKATEAEARYIKIVFINENGSARAVPVETGISDERRVEIRSGLKPNAQVIVAPFRALDEMKDGDAVTIADPSQPDAARRP